MIQVKVSGKLLSAASKSWTMDGRNGIVHKARFLIDGDVFEARTSMEYVSELKKQVYDEGEVTLQFVSPKENLSLNLISFDS